ncbi:MAG: transposase [Nostoc sp.]
MRNETQHFILVHVGFHCRTTSLRDATRTWKQATTQPCILEIVVDRPNLGHYRPLCSMVHYNNLLDRTRTVAGVKALNTDIKVYSPYRARMSEIKEMNSTYFLAMLRNENGKYLCNGGRAHVRATLYIGAVVAMSHNPVIKAFYQRLVERGKSKKLALTACVDQMLVILNAMVRDHLPWCIKDNFKSIVNE